MELINSRSAMQFIASEEDSGEYYKDEQEEVMRRKTAQARLTGKVFALAKHIKNGTILSAFPGRLLNWNRRFWEIPGKA